uniref:MYND-type domain-containing protein n=1 Tax=viral metagenome TaxID=1070528 RepID=A0A6C0LS53_9ZZZZ
MKIIAVIKKNKCIFDKMEEFCSPLLYREISEQERTILKKKLNDYIWSIIEPYITFINVEDEDFLTIACENIISDFPNRSPDEFYYHTEGSYSTPKRYYEIIYAQPTWKDYRIGQLSNMNDIGCLYSLQHNVIENTCIIIVNNYDLSRQYFTVLDSINKTDILKIIRRRYFHSGILIKNNDTMIKFYYQNPSYLLYHIFKKDKVDTFYVDILKYNLQFYLNNETSTYINKIATRINGTKRLYGDVLILHEIDENIYSNLSVHEIRRLNVLSYGRMYDRKLKAEENIQLPDQNNDNKKIVPLWSRFIVSNNRMEKWQKIKNQCINCQKEMSILLTCQKCFRVKYCSSQCENEFKIYHNDECIEF